MVFHKTLYHCAILGLIGSMCLPLLTWGATTPTPEPTVMTLTVNGRVNQDVEVMEWPDGSFSLPLKYVANFVDITAQQSHQTKALTFTNPVNSSVIRVDSESQTITQDETVFEHLPHPLVFVEEGLFSQADIYMDQTLLEQFLSIDLKLDKKAQIVQLSVNRPIKLLLRLTQGNEDDETDPRGADSRAPVKATHEPKNPDQVLETLTLKLDSDTNQDVIQDTGGSSSGSSKTQLVSAGSTLMTGFKGSIFGQEYKLTPTWAYRDGHYGLSDVKFNMKHEFHQVELTMGTINPGLTPLVTPSLPILGFQLASKNAADLRVSPIGTRTFTGKVTGKGRIYLMINGTEIDSQRPANGQYLFSDVQLFSDRDNKVQIIQKIRNNPDVNLDEFTIPLFRNVLHKGEKAYSIFAGRSPFVFLPPSKVNNSGFLQQSNKWLFGGRFLYGITDKLTTGVAVAGDTVLGQAQTPGVNQLLITTQTADLTGYRSYVRDANALSGLNIGSNTIYRLNDHWTFFGDLAASNSKLLLNPTAYPIPPVSVAGQFSTNFRNKSSDIRADIYHYGSAYYTPMSLGDNKIFDRQGIRIHDSFHWKGFLCQAGTEIFQTNIGKVVSGGIINMVRWTGSIYKKLDSKTYFRASVANSQGINADNNQLHITNTEIELGRSLPHNLLDVITYRETDQRSLFNPNNPLELVSVNEHVQKQQIITNDLEIPAPKKLGVLHLVQSVSKEIGLLKLTGMIRWHHLRFSPILQTTMWGTQKILTIGATLAYEFDNGKRIGLTYSYNVSTIPSIQSVIGGSMNQQITQRFQLTYTDTVGLFNHKMKSLGTSDTSQGIVLGKIFLDLNKNGIRDKKEPTIPNIPVLVDGTKPYKSDSKGNYLVTQLSPGIHSLTYDFDHLPLNMTPTSPNANPHVVAGKRTAVDLGIIISPGTLSGSVHVKDASGNSQDATDIMVSLLDESGNQAQFTYTDSQGHYILSDVVPGNYKVTLEPKQLGIKKMNLLSQPIPVNVPVDYTNFYDKSGLDIEVLQLLSK